MAGHDAHGSDGGASEPAAPWPGGWLWALIAGIIAAILAKWLGDVTLVTAVLIGIFVFLVFGVLLGMFWDRPSTHALGANAGGGHDHDDHSHDDHSHDGHDDHGHASATAAPVMAPAAPPVAAPTPASVAAPVAAPAPVAAAAPPASAAVVKAVPPPAAPPAPAPAAPAAPAASTGVAAKPKGLKAARGGKADDLKEIEGIGPVLEKLCNDLGIFHFDQIAAWGSDEIAWMDGNLKGFKGRVSRDKWVAQAKIIGAEGLDAFRIRAKTNNY